MSKIYPHNFEVKIGFNKIREILSANCLSELGREWVTDMSFKEKKHVLERLLGETEEFAMILDEGANFPVSYYFDVRESLRKARIEGTFLEAHELFDLKRSLESIRSIVNFFSNQEDNLYPNLRRLCKYVVLFPYLYDRMNKIISKHGTIKDSASPELNTIRREILSKQSNVSKRMQSLLREAVKSGIVDQDTTVAIRDGRPVIPVAAGNKRKLKGIVHDESATGKTAFVEPAEIVEYNNAIRELEYAEKREIVKILTVFTDDLRPYIDEIENSYEFMGKMDFIRSKAIFAKDIDAIKVDINDGCSISWEKARHPLLLLNLRKEKREIVPLDIELNPNDRILLISGPNAGGKSVCLKTVGIIQYMFQCGMMVPVDENSVMGIFKDIFIDIGDEQSLENDLSTYSSHLMNMKYFTRNCNPESLILIDEFGTGTEPMLGGAIAESILNRLNQLQTFGVITTHYTNLKHFASSVEGIANGAMLYDSHRMEPLFKLQIGKPGSSFAFEIARKIGLSEDILQEATDKVGKDHIHFDKHLRDIVRDKRYWETKRQKIRKSEKKLDDLIERYEKDLDEAGKLRKDIIQKAKEEAETLLSQTNRKIEQTIRTIKEAQAEKERTKKARKSLAEFKEETKEKDIAEEKRIARKIDQIKEREKRKKNRKGTGTEPKTEEKKKPSVKKVVATDFEPGDLVKVAGSGSVGEVVEVSKKNIVVAFGQLMSTVDRKRLERISKNKAKQQDKTRNKTQANINQNLSDRRMTFKSEIDVRGKRVDEALQIVQDFIDEAIMLDISDVRILHGTGNGILRQTLREFLRTEPMVKGVRDEHVQFGGSGISIVTLG
ncbi:endonuclease MutS2 [Puteibacter caeruleilacunae]|nr:endonuclease MutS2 [Puteibacter caeruleilacunae]